ncbi:MAG: hypothetical protein R3321_11315, partial [Nitrososphaeraceae archaeon]|nr:hypothetical protein [Nitrososphaeraceae archaeon]
MTVFATINKDKDKILTGDEVYNIYGDFLPENLVNKITNSYAGMNAYWNCLEKALFAQKIVGYGS